MPHPAKAHVARPWGLTIPLAIEAFGKFGPPKEVERIPKRQRGPMMVTLVVDLGSTFASAFYGIMATGRDFGCLEDLYSEYGGKQYHAAKKRIETLQAAFIAALHEFANTRGSRIYDRSWLSEFRDRLQTLDAKIEGVSEKLSNIRAKIRKQKSFIEAKHAIGEVSMEQMVSAFSSSPSLRDSNLVNILRCSDRIWWDQFESWSIKKLNDLFHGVHGPLLLRHPAIEAAIVRQMNAGNAKLDILGATAKVVSEAQEVLPRQGFRSHFLSSSGAKTLRARLRQADERARQWIDEKGGAGHPLNPYVAPLEDGSKRSVYGPERAINEALWCLSRRNNCSSLFEPYLSHSYGPEEWAKTQESLERFGFNYYEAPKQVH